MDFEARTRLELQKILGFEESTIRMNSIKLSSPDKFDPEYVGTAVADPSDEVLYISQTSDSETLSLWKQKEDSQLPTGPSLMLSDPNIPKSTYVSSSKLTTGQPSYTENVIATGAIESALSSLSAKSYQIAGSHYRKLKIQPIEYIVANGIPFLAGNIIKYATRYKDKGGSEDIRKIIHYCELILEFEYKNETPKT